MISMDKRYRTRDGRPVRVLCVDRDADKPVCALVKNKGEDLQCYGAQGEYWHTTGIKDPKDLIEIPELEFDWSCLPAWAMWVTFDAEKGWQWWEGEEVPQYLPERHPNCPWQAVTCSDDIGKIPTAYAPRYHGSDPAPIFQRPTEETK